jgi:hypothetical protein
MSKERNSSPLPEWIKESNDETDQQKRDAAKKDKGEREATKLVQTGSLDFWKRFVASLKSNGDALKQKKDEQWEGKISQEGLTEICPKMSCHIEVIRYSSDSSGPWSRTMNFEYLPGSTSIQRCYEGTKMADIDLQPGRSGVMAEGVDDENPMTAEQLGEYIVRKLVELARKNKN